MKNEELLRRVVFVASVFIARLYQIFRCKTLHEAHGAKSHRWHYNKTYVSGECGAQKSCGWSCLGGVERYGCKKYGTMVGRRSCLTKRNQKSAERGVFAFAPAQNIDVDRLFRRKQEYLAPQLANENEKMPKIFVPDHGIFRLQTKKRLAR